MAHFTILN